MKQLRYTIYTTKANAITGIGFSYGFYERQVFYHYQKETGISNIFSLMRAILSNEFSKKTTTYKHEFTLQTKPQVKIVL